MRADAPPLPIDDALPALRAALQAAPNAVLQAPPGAGKTTRVPLALLDASWLAGARLVMLEPRRLAARAAAARMALTLGERVGETVGYRVRGDARVGARTRIEVVTEGVLTRMLVADPALDGVGGVIFDEFHERNLVADTGLALALQTQELLRPELRILVMSATLDGAAVARLLGDARVIGSEGRSFPVDVRYVPPRPADRLEAHVTRMVRRALAGHEGDVLVFLPGVGEIRRVESLLLAGELPAGTHVAPLHGMLAPEVQDAAIAPSRAGERKVVLATSIAETSLTIEGVRVVVDAGVARVPRFSPATGMTRLETVRVSRASAEQRRGRAGRVAPGTCWRLWPEHDQSTLLERATPEIMDADLAPLALELAAAGIADPLALRWLDPPPAVPFAQARQLLRELAALDGDGRLTAHGTRLAALPLHPRLAHMVLAGRARGLGALACDVAAILVVRDIARGERGPGDADLRLRVEALRDHGRARAALAAHGLTLDTGAQHRVRAEADRLRRAMGVREGEGTPDDAGVLVALAYPDRVAQRRAGDGARYLLRGGSGATLSGAQSLATSEWLAIAQLDGQRHEARIFLAAPLTLDDVRAAFGDQVEQVDDVSWDATARAVQARRRERLGAIVLRDMPLRDVDDAQVARALVDWIASAGLGVLPWSDAAGVVRARVAFARPLDASFPDLDDAALTATLREWLAPHLTGMRRADDVARLDLAGILLGRLSWAQRTALDAIAPTHLTVPSGSRVPIDYGDPKGPVVAVRLQELFGLAETPRVGRGAVPVTLHLLSPARRPVQVTRDLAGFWKTSYFEVRKELRGRYPKHSWPDNPLAATPTARAKRRGGGH